MGIAMRESLCVKVDMLNAYLFLHSPQKWGHKLLQIAVVRAAAAVGKPLYGKPLVVTSALDYM